MSHADWVTSIDFHPTTQNMFLTTSLDGTVKLWDRNVSKEVKTIDLGSGLPSGQRGVWKAQFTPDGSMIGACTQNGTIALISFEM